MANRYRPDKFAELVLLIASESSDDPKFGEVKLHKLLYFSDFRAYALWGEPITGARYMKNRYGPTARALGPVLKELQYEDRAVIEEVDYFGFPRGGSSRRMNLARACSPEMSSNSCAPS